MISLRVEKPEWYLPPRTRTRGSEPGCPQLSRRGGGEGGGRAGVGTGHGVAPAAAPRPAASSPLRRARRSPARRPSSHVTLRPRSSGAGRRGPSRGMAAASSGTAAWGPRSGDPCRPGSPQLPGCGGGGGREARGPLLFPAPSSRLPPAVQRARFPQRAGAAAHSLTPRAPPRLPAGWGLGRLRPLASSSSRFPSAASPPLRPLCRSAASGICTPKQKRLRSPGREAELGGTQASGRGTAVVGSGCPGSKVRRGLGKKGLWLRRESRAAKAGSGGREQGLQAASRRPRRPGPNGGQRQAGGQTCRGNWLNKKRLLFKARKFEIFGQEEKRKETLAREGKEKKKNAS